jgi:hypothetical protein
MRKGGAEVVQKQHLGNAGECSSVVDGLPAHARPQVPCPALKKILGERNRIQGLSERLKWWSIYLASGKL